MVAEKSISEAFLFYADEQAVLMRNNSLVIGKDSIRLMFEKQSQEDQNFTLTWSPNFIDVAASGDLGYTYGKYTYTVIDSTGTSQKSEGVFHTVWKRQEDGQWKFVWD